MTDGTPGWFRDPTDQEVARWHDGERWTEHTLRIADQTPGVEPPPPVIEPTGFLQPEPEFHIPRQNSSRLGELPGWAKVGIPVLVLLVLVLAAVAFAGGGGGGDDSDRTATADTQAATLDDAVDAARDAGLSDAVSDARAAALIPRFCSVATSGSASAEDRLAQDLGELPATDAAELRDDVEALGAGAKAQCPKAMADAPDLVDSLADDAVTAFATTTTAVTVAPGVTGGTDAGAAAGGTDAGTDSGSTATTKKGSKTTTTKAGSTSTTKATTTTTAKPLPQVLPGQSCSPAGAAGQNKITGGSLTCQKQCYGGTKNVWSSGTCATQPTTPATTPGSPTPTITPPTSSGGGTEGTTGGPS